MSDAVCICRFVRRICLLSYHITSNAASYLEGGADAFLPPSLPLSLSFLIPFLQLFTKKKQMQSSIFKALVSSRRARKRRCQACGPPDQGVSFIPPSLLFYASFDAVFCPVSLRLYWPIHACPPPLGHPRSPRTHLVRMLLRMPRGLGDSDALVQAAGRVDG